MKRIKSNFLVVIVALLCMSSCLEQINDLDKVQSYTWNPSLAFPISNSTFGFDDFLSNDDLDDFIKTDEEGLIILTYEDEFMSQNAASYLEIPDETFEESFSFQLPFLIRLPIDLTIEDTKQYNFSIDNDEGDEIDSAFLNSGSLELILISDFPASGEVIYTFYSVLENGVPVTRTYLWDYPDSLNLVEIIDLGNIKFDLTNGGTTFNSFDFEVTVKLTYEGQTVSGSNSLSMSVNLLAAEFGAIYGKIAEREISSDPETIQLDFFSNLSEGTFVLDEPSVTLEFRNSYGIPVATNLATIIASNDQSSLALSGSITDAPFVIDAPEITQQGEFVNSSIIINNTNSNLPDLINLLPSEITYWLDGTINPAGAVEKSFVLGESVVNIGLNIELPLKGRISNLKAEKEFEFDAATMLDNINFALFQVRVDNGFPLRTELQLYFLDASGQILDILIEGDPTIMEAAPVDGNGIVTNSVEKLMQIELDKDKIDNIQNATTILLEATFSTTDDGNVSVKMLESYEMNIKIGMQTEFQITFDPVNIDPFGI